MNNSKILKISLIIIIVNIVIRNNVNIYIVI